MSDWLTEKHMEQINKQLAEIATLRADLETARRERDRLTAENTALAAFAPMGMAEKVSGQAIVFLAQTEGLISESKQLRAKNSILRAQLAKSAAVVEAARAFVADVDHACACELYDALLDALDAGKENR